MKTRLSLLAALTLCAGCAGDGSNFRLGNVQWSDIEMLGKGVQKAHVATKEFTEAEEIALGQGIASNLLGAAPLLADRRVQRYVNQVGYWLAMQTERPDLPWRFAVLDDHELNAFAAPGGYIFITKGLLSGLKSEAELAGVLAHEIAHVLKKHHLNAIQKSAGTGLLNEFGSAALARGNAKYGQALTRLASAGTEMYVRGLDKEDEFEADRMGVVIAARAGYDPYGLPAVLQGLQTVSPDYAGLALMFKTHPSFSARLDSLDRAMGVSFDRFENQPTLAARFKTLVRAGR